MSIGKLFEYTFLIIITALVITNAGGFTKVAKALTDAYTKSVGALLAPVGVAP